MSSFSTSQFASTGDGDLASPSERYTRALVQLTQAVWHPDCTFDSAVGLICETAAEALGVERVNAWRYDAGNATLHCTHAYNHVDRRHANGDELESLALCGEYLSAMHEARAIDPAEIESDPRTAGSVGVMRDYLRRHRIHALLDAPVRIEGELLGVICHETLTGPRLWTRDEATFAASMGDYVAMAHQIARRKRAENQVRHLQLHDATTDLPNRDFMLELMGQRLSAPRPAGRVGTVVHVRIATAHGAVLSPDAPTLEDIMAQVAVLLDQLNGSQLILGRVRADAFAFLASRAASKPDILRLAQRCISAVRTMPRQHEHVEAHASVGIAFAEVDEPDARILLRKAEQAAERAAESGPYRCEVFDLEHHEELVGRLALERALRGAFAQDQFELHYQPEYDVALGEWSGAEALLRWRTEAGLVVAGDFIATAENSDLMLPLGNWVLRRACCDAVDWPCREAPLVVRVNVSARQFDEDGLVGEVAAALAHSGLAAERLCLEITETTLMRDIERTQSTLNQLKSLGVQIAMDDFGTGYSSLIYLKRFPIDTLKIDRSFVQDLPQDTTDAAIVTAVFGLAETLGIEVVAEGVENSAQQGALQAIGVRRMQGWLYARAMAQPRICELLESGSPEPARGDVVTRLGEWSMPNFLAACPSDGGLATVRIVTSPVEAPGAR